MITDYHNKTNPTTPERLDDDELLDSDATAEILDLKSKHTLDVWRSTKRYPELEYIKIGRSVRYTRGAIRRFKALRTVSAKE